MYRSISFSLALLLAIPIIFTTHIPWSHCATLYGQINRLLEPVFEAKTDFITKIQFHGDPTILLQGKNASSYIRVSDEWEETHGKLGSQLWVYNRIVNDAKYVYMTIADWGKLSHLRKKSEKFNTSYHSICLDVSYEMSNDRIKSATDWYT